MNLYTIIEYLLTVDREDGFNDISSTGINRDIGTSTKKSAVSFKIPDADDRLGKSVGNITAGKYSP